MGCGALAETGKGGVGHADAFDGAGDLFNLDGAGFQLFRRPLDGLEEIDHRRVGAQALGIGETGKRVFRGRLGHGDSALDGKLSALFGEVGEGDPGLALADEDAHTGVQAFRTLDVLQLAVAHRQLGLARLADGGFGVVGTSGAGTLDEVAGNLLQAGGVGSGNGVCHALAIALPGRDGQRLR